MFKINLIIILLLYTVCTVLPATGDQPEFYSVIGANTNNSELPIDENISFYSTGLLVPEHLRNSHYVVSSTQSAYPSKWDWRKHDGVTPVKDQGKCGSCYAFGAVGMVESGIKVYDGITYDLSEEQAKSCMWELGGCTGGTVQWVMNPFTCNGVILEKDYPYFPINGVCYPFEPIIRVTDWHMISTEAVPSRDVIKSYILQAPLVTAMTVSGWDTDYNGSYVLDNPDPDPDDPDKEGKSHAVILVGWNDSISDNNVSGHWIFKNSWGKSWGDNGYGYIEYDTAKIGTHMSILGGYEDYDPYTHTLNYDEAGWNDAVGANGFDCIRAMCKFDLGHKEVVGIEFWTTGVTSNVNFQLYNYWGGGIGFGELLYSSEDLCYHEPGYHSIKLDKPVMSTTGEIVVVGNFTNTDCIYFDDKVAPIAIDNKGSAEVLKTFVSIGGDPNHKWYDKWYDMSQLPMDNGDTYNADVALRLRVYEGNPEYKNITISTSDPTENVSVGDTVNFTAVCIDDNDKEIYCGKIEWISYNETVGILDSSTFTALEEGNTTVFAKGNKTSNIIPISVIPAEPVCDYIVLYTEDYVTDIHVGDEVQFIYTCLDQYVNKIECGNVTWNNDNESVGVMNGTTFTGLAKGLTNITVTGNCTHKYSNSVQMNVTDKLVVVTPEPTSVPTVKRRSGGSSIGSSGFVIITPTETQVPIVESNSDVKYTSEIINKPDINITTSNESNNTTIPLTITPTIGLPLFVISALIIGLFLIYKSNKK